MRYFVFIDESGEANMHNPDPRFNIFVLCAIVFREDHYEAFNRALKELKRKYFGNEDTVFHSIKMRSRKGAFTIFQDDQIQQAFYGDIKQIFTQQSYTVLSCIVNKDEYKRRYQFKNHAYEDALKFICERAINLTDKTNKNNVLHFCLEKRGSNKDVQLKKYYTHFVTFGTEFMSTDDFRKCHPKLWFRGKEQNINGLQFADLCAYPIARKTLSPDRPQPTYDLFESKIYSNWRGNKIGWGLKHFP